MRFIRVFFLLVLMFSGSMSTDAEKVFVVAHRGASQDAPENTMPAFRLAWEQGADAVEGDFHLTKDGEIVCIHDSNTKKIAEVELEVRESTLAELKTLDVGARVGEHFIGATIPTIGEVFSSVPDDKQIYVELKCGPEIIPALLEAIRDSGLKEEQIRVISFNEQLIKSMKAEAPQFRAFWLCAFKKRVSDAVKPSLESILETLSDISADGLSSNLRIPRSFVEAIGEQGYEWHVWTVNDSETAKRMQTWGAKSITTDVPGSMRGYLAE